MEIIRGRLDLIELSSRYFYEGWDIGGNWVNQVMPIKLFIYDSKRVTFEAWPASILYHRDRI